MINNLRSGFVHTRRDAWVEINLSCIEHNIRVLKSLIDENDKFLAVVKADAYGHGATMLAPTLEASGVDMFGVASVDEGIQLRNSGIKKPILVLGAVPIWSVEAAVENRIQISVFSKEHIEACRNAYEKLKIKPEIHIKVDTGMHRIGIPCEIAVEFIKSVAELDFILLEGVFTHLPCAEDKNISYEQNKKWLKVIDNLPEKKNLLIHILNTAGLISYKDFKCNMVRAGIGIYGLSPALDKAVEFENNLKQLMSVKGRVVHVQELHSGEGVSYGYKYITDKTITKVATIPIGYADGISRNLSNRIYGLINGVKVPQIGNITMDQMMFDITDLNDIKVGDVITILGKDEEEIITIDSWAEKLNTINYEIPCRLRVRLPRVYSRDFDVYK